MADIKAGCQFPNAVGSSKVCDGNKCVGGASTQPFWACLQYPNGIGDCLGNPYDAGNSQYDAAKSLSHSTIGHANSYIGENNCNNYLNDTTIHTTDLDPIWAGMSLVSAGSGVAGGNYNYPKTFMYSFLCHGPDLVGTTTYSNSSAAQGWAYANIVSTASLQNGNGKPSIYRVDACTDPEMIWGPNALAEGTGTPFHTGFAESRDMMLNNCVQH